MDLIPLANDCVSRCEELVKMIKHLEMRDAAAPEQQKLAHAREELENSKESLTSILLQLYQKAKHIEQACNDRDACRAGLNNDERKALFRFRAKYEKLQHEGDGNLQSLIHEYKLLSIIRPFHTSHTHQDTDESFEEDIKRQRTAWTPKTYRPILLGKLNPPCIEAHA